MMTLLLILFLEVKILHSQGGGGGEEGANIEGQTPVIMYLRNITSKRYNKKPSRAFFATMTRERCGPRLRDRTKWLLLAVKHVYYIHANAHKCFVGR